MADIRLRSDVFDAFAAGYDGNFARTGPGRLLRESVWQRLAPHVRPGSRALDLGCGTGEDALWLAANGCAVTAVDASPAMLDTAWRKAIDGGMGDRIETRLFDLNAPHEIEGSFDLILSNFGALNCVVDLAPLSEMLRSIVAPGGLVAAVVMGRFCAFETLWYGARVKRTAWRRWTGRSSATIGGKRIPIRYWQPGDLRRALGPAFRIEAIHPIGSFLPPSDLFPLLERRPRLFATLARWESRVSSSARAAYFADHHLTLLRRVS
jgi:ubiquinone/menaquinone biosynthesis C-methylase UbiE